jgi:hypothetical protein
MTRLLALAVSVVALTGCGNANPHGTSNSTSTAAGGKGKGSALTPRDLHDGVVAALHANHKLAIRVLWTNQVPATASRSTRGPALAGMRASAKGRQRQKVRVRMLHDDYRIISIRLDPSYASAIAVVQANQKELPSAFDGKPLGRALELRERARIELHRIGSSRSFVVWRLTLLQ